MASYSELRAALEAVLRATRTCTLMEGGSVLNNADRLLGEAAKGMTAPTGWTPFERASPGRVADAQIRRAAKVLGVSFEEARAEIARITAEGELYVNSRYQVALRRDGKYVHLSIKRIDQQPIRVWRDLQRIKNELVGPECEAIELFPAESRLVDTANQFHLWCVPDSTHRFPFGMPDRMVEEAGDGGEAQEPFEA